MVLAEGDRQQQGEGHPGHYRQQDIEQVIAQRLPEDVIGKQAGKVIQPDILRAVAGHAGIK